MRLQMLLALALTASALNVDARQLGTVREYCTVVEARIVTLAEMVVSTNTEMSKYAVDQPTADTIKFKEAQNKLESFSASLKENEEEWSRLNCAHILSPRPK